MEDKKRIAVFAGTTEGHELAIFFRDRGRLDQVDFYVATEYGRSTLEDVEDARVIAGRLGPDQMAEVLSAYCLIIDATHPYAEIVTRNLQEVCSAGGMDYLRLIREDGGLEGDQEVNITFVDSTEEAIRVLDDCGDRFLLTTGAKDLPLYGKVKDFTERGVARVLPSHSSIDACLDAGLPMKSIIGMQGPFTLAMNRAMMDQYDLKILVTKSTGRAGGFGDKVMLAQDGYRVIVIGRPTAETGYTMEEILERLDHI